MIDYCLYKLEDFQIGATQIERGMEMIRLTLAETEKYPDVVAAYVRVFFSSELTILLRDGKIELLQSSSKNNIIVTVFLHGRKGVAFSTNISRNGICEAVTVARKIAYHVPKDRCFHLPRVPEFNFHDAHNNLQIYYPVRLDLERASEVLKELELYALKQSPLLQPVHTIYTLSHSSTCFGTSHNIFKSYRHSLNQLRCHLMASNKTETQNCESSVLSRRPIALEEMQSISLKAANRAIAKLDPKSVRSLRSPVIFEAESACSLMSHFCRAIFGRNLIQGNSFLAEKLGMCVFPEHIDIYESPLLDAEPGSRPFDSEGIPTRFKNLVKKGKLMQYLLDSYSAAKLRTRSTGNAADEFSPLGINNLTLKSTHRGLAELLKEMHKGLLITQLYGNINAVTGAYSRGASGFRVENGVIEGPVNGFTISGNLNEMYMGIVGTGADYYRQQNIICGSILIKEMIIAGAS